jgi:hypothetical protein
METNVSAAAVYKALSVAAGWGEAGVKSPHARVALSTRSATRIFIKRVKDISISNSIINHYL